MQAFTPQKILIEAGVAKLPRTQKICKYFASVPQAILQDARQYKEPAP